MTTPQLSRFYTKTTVLYKSSFMLSILSICVLRNHDRLILFYFTDIDECAEGKHGCTPHSTCNNTDGGYDCVCNSGYKAEGSLCVG